MALLLLGFYTIQGRNEPIERIILLYICYQTSGCLPEENEKENEVEMYICIHKRFQNLSCIG